MSKTKNLGQVSGVFIGMEAPKNTTLIWYDNTPSQKCHKIYDPVINGWKVLSPDIVSNTTYSELIASAKKNGLSVGKHYVITDKSNILAIAITTTKVQYFDSLGNILIDDLGVNIQYHVSSGNLLIDDINGVFDSSRNKLIFRFEEKSEIDFENDYFLSKTKNATNWILSKFKISSLLSRSTNNSISWDRGLFFSFKNAINKILNKDGGIVGYDDYKSEISQINRSVNTISKNTQEIILNVNKSITENTKDSVIYNKKLQGNIDTSVVPGDIQKNDTLFTIISKFQRWINNFKTATGIKISTRFSEKDNPQYINTNDTVESALEKLQYHVKKPTGVLPEDWTEIENIEEEINMPVANDNLSTIVRKIVGKLRQIGDITYGKIRFSNNDVVIQDNLIFQSGGILPITEDWDEINLSEFLANGLKYLTIVVVGENSENSENVSNIIIKLPSTISFGNYMDGLYTDYYIFFHKDFNDPISVKLIAEDGQTISYEGEIKNSVAINLTSSKGVLHFFPQLYSTTFCIKEM